MNTDENGQTTLDTGPPPKAKGRGAKLRELNAEHGARIAAAKEAKATRKRSKGRVVTPPESSGAGSEREFHKRYAAADKKGEAMELFATEAASQPMEVGVINHRDLPIESVFIPSSFNARRVLWGPAERGEDLATFAADLKRRGLLEPIVVYEAPGPEGTTRYALVAGERRLAALRHLRAQTVTAHVRAGTVEQAHSDNAAENTQRKQLASWEIASECVRLRERGLPMAAIGSVMACTPSYVSNYCRVHDGFKLVPAAWEAFKQGAPGMRDALAILTTAGKLAGDQKEDPKVWRASLERAWEAYASAQPAPRRTDAGEDKDGAPPKPSKREVRGVKDELRALLSPAAALPEEHRPAVEGALWALGWAQGEAKIADFMEGRKKVFAAARKRLETVDAEKAWANKDKPHA